MWTEKQLQHLKADGRIRGYKSATQVKPKHAKLPGTKPSREKEWLNWNLMYWANDQALQLVTEHQFDEKRKWRFDWALPAINTAIEYEGIFSQKSRHTTISGYTGDVEKYNRAQSLGWRVIRLTAKNYKTVLNQLNQFINDHNEENEQTT